MCVCRAGNRGRWVHNRNDLWLQFAFDAARPPYGYAGDGTGGEWVACVDTVGCAVRMLNTSLRYLTTPNCSYMRFGYAERRNLQASHCGGMCFLGIFASRGGLFTSRQRRWHTRGSKTDEI